MTAPPKWAQDLTLRALEWWEAQGHTAPLVSLSWRHRAGVYSSGIAGLTPNGVLVRGGSSRLDQRMVLLHELAHLLAESIRGGQVWVLDHPPVFWETAWALYRWAKLPIRYCLREEGNYRKGAVLAYRRSRKGVKCQP